MDILVLKPLTELFAILAHMEAELNANVKSEFVHSYFNNQFGHKHASTYIKHFNEYLAKYESVAKNKLAKYDSQLSVKLLIICNRLNIELSKKQKIQILINLLLFVKSGANETALSTNYLSTIDEYIKTISESLHIDEPDYNNSKLFVNNRIHEISDKQDILVYGNQTDTAINDLNFQTEENLQGRIYFLHIKSINIFLCKYDGTDTLEINNKELYPDNVYILDNGSFVNGNQLKTIYYSDILTQLLKGNFLERNEYKAENIEYIFPGSKNGIHQFSFYCESGQLVAIMGPSGAGKSTLLNLLLGKIPIQKGSITLNGFNIAKDSDKVKSIIGYVPQDDLLINELSVYQNLYYNSKLYLGNVDNDKIIELVKNTLVKLDLFKIKDLKVGSPLDKFISGGERKRLNIAMELMREPSVLFLDEPTSGLSSSDSKKVIQILKNLTLQGKLIILNIHQPSSDVFKLFNKLLIIDTGGYPIFFGNQLEALPYFSQKTRSVQAYGSECPTCGNVNPEEILQIIEEKEVTEYGDLTETRKISPEFWYKEFLQHFTFERIENSTHKLSESKYLKASAIEQFKIYFTRNILSKLKDKYYLLLTFLVPPILAIILGYFTKYIAHIPGKPAIYTFFNNENIPAFIFMAVLVALFLGLILSAEEIIKDKGIIEKERYLNLNKFSYYHSKIVVLFLISAMQLFVFVVIANSILGIHHLYTSYFIILFTAACFANLLGLILSSTIKSVVAIYIVIPLVLIPQILLGGIIVKYDKLYEPFISQKYTPLIGDLMISRWTFESLALNQYENNYYTKSFFNIEKEESNLSYDSYYLITELKTLTTECRSIANDSLKRKVLNQKLILIEHELSKIDESYHFALFHQNRSAGNIELYLGKVDSLLDLIKNKLLNKLDTIIARKEQITTQLSDSIMINSNNEALNNLLLGRGEIDKLVRTDNSIIRKYEPIYQIPESKYGRAQFFSSEKRIGKHHFNTIYFNLFVIWLINLVLYGILVFEIPLKLSEIIRNIYHRLNPKNMLQ